MYQNIQYLSNKVYELEVVLGELDPIAFILTEHGLNVNNVNSVDLNGYYSCSSYSRNVHKGGGVIIYARNNIKSEIIKWVGASSIEMDFEVTAAKLICTGTE